MGGRTSELEKPKDIDRRASDLADLAQLRQALVGLRTAYLTGRSSVPIGKSHAHQPKHHQCRNGDNRGGEEEWCPQDFRQYVIVTEKENRHCDEQRQTHPPEVARNPMLASAAAAPDHSNILRPKQHRESGQDEERPNPSAAAPASRMKRQLASSNRPVFPSRRMTVTQPLESK